MFHTIFGHYRAVFAVSALLAASGLPSYHWPGLRPRLHSVASGMQDYVNLGIHHTVTKQSTQLHTVHVHYVVPNAQVSEIEGA